MKMQGALAKAIGFLILLVLQLNAHAADYPFVGKWKCEVGTFTFTSKTYNNGMETLHYQSIQMEDGEFTIMLKEGFVIYLSQISKRRMIWSSGNDGDEYLCRRLK
jgi:hypothetical protein